ncbi:MAG TPA: SRPBCC family protein [Mycobacteriales bacterium]|nr:SRPBCC family protein [Mycobacteriales bacterium]
MKLENSFTVPVTADVAWPVLLDVERIAPCMPGATLTGQEGDEFTGTVKVKVGPVSLTYGGKATFVSRDDDNHVAVIEASGKETRGSGTAKAVITTRLSEADGATTVDVETELTITGKPAQFGRGVMAEISGKLIGQFAACLAEKISADAPAAAGSSTPADPASDAASSSPALDGDPQPSPEGSAHSSATSTATPLRPVPEAGARPTPEAIDLLDTAGLPILKRVAPLLAGLFVLYLLLRRRGR